MNVHVIVAILLALPATSGQFTKNSQLTFCKVICNLIIECEPTSAYCSSNKLQRFMKTCQCSGSQPTAPPKRTPAVSNGCGVGSMGNPKRFLDTLPRIIGGDNATQGYFPWQVKVRPGAGHCGGTLVSSDTVVTAAHCVTYFVSRPSSVEVAYGSVDTNNAQRVTASRVIVHPNYSKTSQPDIAIIKLSRSISITKNARPACLPRAFQAVTPNKLAIVTGWGILTEVRGKIPNIMQYVPVPIVSQQQCKDNYNGGISDSEFCAGYSKGGRDACQGDSGGGLVMPSPSGDRWELIGVVSRGIGCARANYPGIYARVPNYISWIRQYI